MCGLWLFKEVLFGCFGVYVFFGICRVVRRCIIEGVDIIFLGLWLWYYFFFVILQRNLMLQSYCAIQERHSADPYGLGNRVRIPDRPAAVFPVF